MPRLVAAALGEGTDDRDDFGVRAGIGERVARVEDARLLTGRGRFTDDFNLPDQAYGVVVRAPVAHGIVSLDVTAARAMPGVLAVLTAADAEADGLGLLPCPAFAAGTLKRADGTPAKVPPRPVLAGRRVRHVGEALAFVVAQTRAQALDAAEAVSMDSDERGTVTAPDAAVAEGAPAVWDDAPDNIAFRIAMGDERTVAGALAEAAHVVAVEIPVSRVVPSPMEPRAALGVYDPAEDRYTLYSGTQGPHRTRRVIAETVLGVPETHLRVVSPDMGGAFGMRSDTYPEMILVLWAARRLGRAVKWTGERSEAFVSDNHGRDAVYRVELALDANGIFQAVRCRNVTAVGAYLSIAGGISAFAFLPGLAGVYRTPHIWAEATGVFTHTPPVAPYRGAGRPESILAIEYVIDAAARALGIDPIELRRRNLIARDQMPFRTGLRYVYDSGDFAANMDKALAAIDADGFSARRGQAEQRGKLRGLGVINAIEAAGGVFIEGADLRFDPSGSLTLAVGTHSHGQGHETTFKQLVAAKLGVDFDRIRFVQGDTDQVPFGSGTFASRSVMMGGGAIGRAADMLIDKGKRIASHRLEAATEDIEFTDGRFTIAGTDRGLTLTEVARIAYTAQALPPEIEPGLMAFAPWDDATPTFPNGCHAAEVEIDPETGSVRIVRYVAVEDAGTVINPLLLEGQMHGGIVQGIGQVLCEAMVYDHDSGQPLSGSFMDYCIPRADDVSDIEVISNPHPTPSHPLGVKGAGEAGTVGALPCLLAAVNDALTRAGAAEIAMPATPERVWRALRGVRHD
jgi:carbon-monoxide dehydrogenase large subunit